jgi:hypothetical protein
VKEEKETRKWWEEKLAAIQEGEELVGEVFCSEEEGLVCVGCGDAEVKRNADLREACHPEKAGGHRKVGGGGSAGARDGKQMSSHSIAAVGLLLSTQFGNFRW